MKWLLPLILFCSIGCLQPEGGDPVPTPVVSSTPAFYSALASYVESDECQTTDEFLKVAGKSARLRKVTLGPAWDAAFAETIKKNSDLTPEIRAEIAAKCRGMK